MTKLDQVISRIFFIRLVQYAKLALETELQQEEVGSDASANGAENKKGFWRRIFG